jgi:hypothetical protein
MRSSIDGNKIAKIFPDYFKNFEIPEGAREETITVYRACRTGKCDRESFLPTFEENGYQFDPMLDPSDPGQYSLSTFEKPSHIKRFASMNSDMQIPYKIAIGNTNPDYGLVQRTKERKKSKTSHVDWWIYKDATPYLEFEIIVDFERYLENYKNGSVTSR